MPDSKTRDRLLAILAADVAGYSRLMSLDDRATVVALDAARAVFHQHVAAQGGSVIDMAGDSVLAVFETATAAVNSAIAVQSQLTQVDAREATVPERRMRFRIGIHLGDVIEKADGTVYGDGVNIASRLEGLAEPGGIVVSKAVRDTVARRVPAAFEDIGEQTVKNIAEPLRAYRLLASGEGAPRPEAALASEKFKAAWRRGLPRGLAMPALALSVVAAAGGLALWQGWLPWSGSPRRPAPAGIAAIADRPRMLSILVLPFANQSGDPQKAYIADALTSSITSDLTRIRDAFVIPTATAFTYKDKAWTVHQIGEYAGVRFVLQGAVVASGEHLRVSAQLADASSGAQLWNSSFEGETGNLFALLDQVTARIGNSIGREMVIVAAREAETRMRSPTAADLVLRAQALTLGMTLQAPSTEHFHAIEALYRQSLTLDAKSATVMVGLARVLIFQAAYGYLSDPVLAEQSSAEGLAWALRAKQIDPDNPEIYALLAVHAGAHADFDGARSAAETYLRLQPKNTDAYRLLGSTYLDSGEPRKAIELLNQAVNLDPDHVSVPILANMGIAHFMLGDNEDAIRWLLKVRERNPDSSVAHAFLAMAYASKGDDARAGESVVALKRAAPNYSLSLTDKPKPSQAAAYRDYWEKVALPAMRKAGVPE